MECEFSEHEIAMPAGSRAFLYSDGVTEVINSALEEYVQSVLADVANDRRCLDRLIR